MKKKGLIVLILVAVYVLCFGGYALTVETSAVTDTLEGVSIQIDTGTPVSPLTTIVPYPPPPPYPKPTEK